MTLAMSGTTVLYVATKQDPPSSRPSTREPVASNTSSAFDSEEDMEALFLNDLASCEKILHSWVEYDLASFNKELMGYEAEKVVECAPSKNLFFSLLCCRTVRVRGLLYFLFPFLRAPSCFIF